VSCSSAKDDCAPIVIERDDGLIERRNVNIPAGVLGPECILCGFIESRLLHTLFD
jgi:hypothetical protein